MSTPLREDLPERSVAVTTLGCARNEVDSEELAGRLAAQGWRLVDDPAQADVAVVNTCGFVEQAKKDSIDALLEAAELKSTGRTQAVVAVGCLAQRYGEQLAAELPEADAVLGFDSYGDLSSHLGTILAGGEVASHTPVDRRRMLPLSPTSRQERAGEVSLPGHGQVEDARVDVTAEDLGSEGLGGPRQVPSVTRALLEQRVWAPLKIASGCDRRCAFCAIPAFRGAFVSRRPGDVVTEARWLAERGVDEVLLVSENSTSYGKDLGDLRLLETLLPELASIDGIEQVRVSYLQPAEIRPTLLEVMTSTPKIAPYFDISFQHASGPLLRRMRRFGDRASFLDLLARIRALSPDAGVRTNVIVGFPGETEDDLGELIDFLTEARLDVVGVFGYSDEDGTEAESYDGKLEQEVIDERVRRVTDLVEELTARRAAERIGQITELVIEELADPDDREDTGWGPIVARGRAPFQGPDVDGGCELITPQDAGVLYRVGQRVPVTIVASAGVDLQVMALADVHVKADDVRAGSDDVRAGSDDVRAGSAGEPSAASTSPSTEAGA